MREIPLASRIHMDRVLKSKKGAVMCDCGYPAQLSPDCNWWQCQTAKCQFSVLVADAENVPDREFSLRKVRGESELIDGGLKPKTEPIDAEHMTAIRREEKQQRRIAEALGQCGWSWEQFTEEEYVVFAGFVAWFDSKFTSGMSAKCVEDLMPRYLESLATAAA